MSPTTGNQPNGSSLAAHIGNVASLRCVASTVAMDIDKNLLLVKSIEKFPCLYNYNLIDYAKKDVTDKAWNEVSNETKLTVGECKEKWKNLRYGFIRSLRPNPDGSVKKKYYLHDDMEFVLPFVKLLPKHSGYVVPTVVESGDTDEENNEIVENGQSPHNQQFFDLETLQQEPPKKRMRTEPIIKQLQYKHAIERIDDSRRMFLLSLLPEVNELTESQMRAFRRRVLSLIDEIVDTPNQCDTNIFQWHKEQTQGCDIIKTEIP